MKKPFDVSVHPFAAAGLFLLIFASSPAYGFAVLTSVFLHEMGHTTAALLLGKRILSVRIVPTGINIILCGGVFYRGGRPADERSLCADCGLHAVYAWCNGTRGILVSCAV